MVNKILISILIVLIISAFACKPNISESTINKIGLFNPDVDLLLANFDCKTDVDDLHSVAAFITLLSEPSFSTINYHAVAGTYGVQEGLYVPANNLFELAFKDNWSDAHSNLDIAIEEVKTIAQQTFSDGGDIWIAEAGQSDFSAKLIQAIQIVDPKINVTERIHIVQHSEWNQKSTSVESLQFVKENIDYHKIPDGNAVGNGTPGFRSPEFTLAYDSIKNAELQKIWKLAVDLGNQYNGKEGRYNNEAVSSGGLDFSDISETCWILGLEDIEDVEEFFSLFAR